MYHWAMLSIPGSGLAGMAAIATGLLSCSTPQQPKEGPSAAVRAPIFELHSNLWINLHQELLHRSREKEDFHHLLPDRPLDPTWSDAISIYRGRYGQLSNLDPRIFELGVRMAIAESGPPPALDPDVAEPISRAAESYRQSAWPADDQRNRAWIAQVSPLLDRFATTMAEEIARANEVTWPKETIRVEVVTFADPFGAQTDTPPPMTVISSVDPGYQGQASLEMLFHEASHVLGDGVQNEIDARARSLRVKVPDGLWHAVLFYTAGYFAKRHLGEQYVTYGDAQGVFKRGWEKARPVLADVWEPHLRGETSMRDALAEIVRRLGEPSP
jgi:hypothetical protein